MDKKNILFKYKEIRHSSETFYKHCPTEIFCNKPFQKFSQ